MKINYNPKTGLPEIQFDNQDLEDAYAVKHLINNNPCPNCKAELPKSWEVLKKYWEIGKDSILISGTDGIKNRAKRELSDIKWAILKGYIEFCAIPERLIARADEFIENERKEMIKIVKGENDNDE